MAGLKFTLQSSEFTTGTSAKTVLQAEAPTNQNVLVKEISISFKGVVNTDPPILVEVYHQTTAGSGGDALTPAKGNPNDSSAIQSTALENIDGSSSPMDGVCIMREEVHPQTGFLWQAPFGGEEMIPGGGRLGIKVTATVSRSMTARMKCEE